MRSYMSLPLILVVVVIIRSLLPPEVSFTTRFPPLLSPPIVTTCACTQYLHVPVEIETIHISIHLSVVTLQNIIIQDTGYNMTPS